MRRKGFAVLMAVMFVLSMGFMSCGAGAGGAGAVERVPLSFTNGKFIGSAMGYHLTTPVTVSVSFSETAILAVEVIGHAETAPMGTAAIEAMPHLVVQHQTLAVDTITGVTMTSLAILHAIEEAAIKADGDIEALWANEAFGRPGTPIVRNVDVVVLGAGGAGIGAALKALEEGASTLVLEAAGFVGGNTTVAAGWNVVRPDRFPFNTASAAERAELAALLDHNPANVPPGFREALINLKPELESYLAGTHIHPNTHRFDSWDLQIYHTYLASIHVDLQGNRHHAVYEIARHTAETSLSVQLWLENLLGTTFGNILSRPPGILWGRIVSVTGGWDNSVFRPAARFINSNPRGEILLSTRAHTLIQEDGAVVGVRATRSDGTPVTVRAGAVVIATGGFAANSVMIVEHNIMWPNMTDARLPTTNVGTTAGDHIVMAEQVGAALDFMGFTQFMMGPGDGRMTALGPAPGGGRTSIWISPQTGRRFVREDGTRTQFAEGIFAQGGRAFNVFQHNTAHESRLGTGFVFAAETLEGLETQLNLPPGSLVAEVARYNGFITGDRIDVDFGRNIAATVTPIVGPFMASVIQPTAHITPGGIVNNTRAEVIHRDGHVIPGLYVAGESMAVMGGQAVAVAWVFGTTAGTNAARFALR